MRHLPTYIKTAKVASDDYPELAEILEERPPHARALPTNRRTALKAPPPDAHRLPPPNEDEWIEEYRPFLAFWHTVANSNDEGYNEPDWDEAGYTFGPSTRDSDMDPDMDSGMSGVVASGIHGTDTPRSAWVREGDECTMNGGSMTGTVKRIVDLTSGKQVTVQWHNPQFGETTGRHRIVDLSRLSSKVAAWEDVQQKAHDIFEIGGVHVLAITENSIAADVLGDHGTYQTELDFVPGSSGRARAIAQFHCTCPWAQYSSGRSGRWKKYENRQCSHAVALMYAYQSNPQEGLMERAGPGDWDTDKITYSEPSKPSEWRVGSIENEAIPTLTTGNPAPGEDIAREWATVPAAGASGLGDEIQVISAAYRDMPVLDESVADLWIEAALMFQMIAADLSKEWDIQVLDVDPYSTAEEMFEDMRKGVYKVTTLHSNHPVWSVDDNVKFRIVHDITGHWESGGDFSFTGETMAYQGQCKHLPEHLWPVIFTEVVAQSAYANVHHLFGEQKVGLIKYTPEEAAAFVGKVLDGPRPDDYLHVSASIKEEWKPGERAYFEYHCFESESSNDAILWHHSHQQVTVVGMEESTRKQAEEYGLDTYAKRLDAALPIFYHVKFDDGLEYEACEDELSTSSADWDRPDPPHYPTKKAKEPWSLEEFQKRNAKIGVSLEEFLKTADVWDNDGMATDQNAQPEVGSLDAPEEPEAALPSTEGDFVPGDDRLAHLNSEIPSGPSDGDIASAARDYLEKAGVKTFTFAEQQALIKEGEDVVASNLDRLDITGTHYEALEAQLAQAERTGESVLWWD